MPEPECEFKEVCAIVWGVDECPIDSDWWKDCLSGQQKKLEAYHKSPQFTKQYTTWKNCESIRDTAHKDGIAFGQQNPDQERFVDRKELVEEVKMCSQTIEEVMEDYDTEQVEVITRDAVLDIIRTHGLEEE